MGERFMTREGPVGDWKMAGGRMLGWIEKVVPQPPVNSSVPVVVEKDAKPESKAKETKSGHAQQPLEGHSSHPAAGSEKKEVVAPAPALPTERSGQKVLTWLSQGLGKAMPQPLQPATMLQAEVKTSDACSQTDAPNVEYEDRQAPSVPETSDPSGGEGELQTSSDNGAPEKTGAKKVFTRFMEGFEKIVPQPENVKKTVEATPEDRTADQGNMKGSSKEMPQKEISPTKPLAQHRASTDSQSRMSVSLFPQTLGGNGGSSIFKRFMHGLEKAIPQPASKEKQDEQSSEAGGLGPGQERSKGA
ncbi:cyclic nucleotide-gated cation channel beta-1-like isoform X1 [Sphaerodactylus townsendi]|uniref:cyclic nucleotide-gated cation channel beta-1-like isoform X1 n=1 Tax=Sphaerodactylus townsendi TaxID=933632 RepID=UPI00202702F5|nr:cyclic nucleotide-gated cation channel beta-1-like isoform X1 [Sphaerodactylus townsendi]